MADDHPEHGNPVEGEPCDDPVGVLERWESSGGHWRVLARFTVDLAAYLADRTHSDD